MSPKDFFNLYMEIQDFQELARKSREDAYYWECNVINGAKKKEQSDWDVDSFLGELVNYIHIRKCRGPIADKWNFYITKICNKFRDENGNTPDIY